MPEKEKKEKVKAKRHQYAYDSRAYDPLHLQVPKGKRAIIQARAIAQNKSLNSYICGLIMQDMGISLDEWKRREADENND